MGKNGLFKEKYETAYIVVYVDVNLFFWVVKGSYSLEVLSDERGSILHKQSNYNGRVIRSDMQNSIR